MHEWIFTYKDNFEYYVQINVPVLMIFSIARE